MARVWSGRDASEAFGEGNGKRGAAREAKRKYQVKERELEGARTELAQSRVGVHTKKEAFARTRRGVEKRQLEILQLEREQRDLERALKDLEQQVNTQKRRVSRLEHEVEQLREAAFRGRSFGV